MQRGRVDVDLIADDGGNAAADAAMEELGQALTSFRDNSIAALQPWVRKSEQDGLWTIVEALKKFATGIVNNFEAGIDMLTALPGEFGALFTHIKETGQDWIERMVLIASETNAFEYSFHCCMAVVMNMTPNFWAEMFGVASGYILPEVLIELVLAMIAALSGGSTAGQLAGRLALLTAKISKAAAGVKGLAVFLRLLKGFENAIAALKKIGDGLHRAISATARDASDRIVRLRHELTQLEFKIDPNTLGMNGGNIRIVRKCAKMHTNISDHIKKRDLNVPRRRGIGGAHDKAEFEQELIKERGAILNRTPHQKLAGVEKRISNTCLGPMRKPNRRREKQTIPKKVYDSRVLTDADMLRMGQEAADSAMSANDGVLPRQWVGKTSEGVTIRGYSDNGVVSSFFPEIN